MGHLAVQIAKSLGAHVIGTARTEKHALLKELGADELIDYTAQDFADVVHDVDVVLDTIGGEYEERSTRTLRTGGILVSLNPFGGAKVAVMVEPDHTALERLTALVDQGKLRPIVAQTFPLAAAAHAHEVGERNQTTGKLVLTI